MNFRFTVSSWVVFIHNHIINDDKIVPMNTIGQIGSRSYLVTSSETKLVYLINIPDGNNGWKTVTQVPEEILAKFDRRLGTDNEVTIQNIRTHNVENSNKISKEMTDMDEYMTRYYVNASLFQNEFFQRQDASSVTPVKIVFNNPATIVFWKDGTKTVVKRQKGTPFNKYYGYLAALGKKFHGSTIKVERLIEQIGIEEKPAKKPRKKCNASNEKDGVQT